MQVTFYGRFLENSGRLTIYILIYNHCVSKSINFGSLTNMTIYTGYILFFNNNFKFKFCQIVPDTTCKTILVVRVAVDDKL